MGMSYWRLPAEQRALRASYIISFALDLVVNPDPKGYSTEEGGHTAENWAGLMIAQWGVRPS